MTAETLLVTGASGFVGSSILESRAAGGVAVGLVRKGRGVPSAPAGVTYRTLDAWSESGLTAALDGVTSVVHCASVVHRPDATESEYVGFNVEGTRALLKACRNVGVRRLVFMSTIKVYGENVIGVLDERTPVVGDTPYARTKIDAERLVFDAAGAGGLSAAVLRLCPVFGRGDKGNVRAMIAAIARRRFVLPGRGENRKSIVHASTVADVAHAVLGSQKEGVFVVADAEAPTMRTLADTIARALAVTRPPVIPEALVHAAVALFERASGLLGRQPTVTRERLRKLVQATVCSPVRAQTELGVGCHVDLAWAIADEIAWLRQSSLI